MKQRSGFLASGHLPTLIGALLYFDVSFMAWVMLGPLAPFLRDEFGLSATGQGLLIATPLLGGSVFRPLLGVLGDRIGGRRAGLLGLMLTLVALCLGWIAGHSLAALVLVAFLLGIAGASFAVALPLASRWYPPEYQGIAMGVAGAGNSGTLFATLLAPRLAERFGWVTVFGFAMLPVALILCVFALIVRDSPARRPAPSRREYLELLREPDTMWLAALYCLTFGGFVGFSSFLPTFFREQFHLSRVAAGDFTTVAVVAGSLLRPVGGWLADRIGGYRLLVLLLAGVAATLAVVATAHSPYVAVAIMFVTLGLLGMGNGAVFQMAPQRFPDRMGIVTGIVGAAGGLGGFFLPTLFGIVKDATGAYSPGVFVVSGLFAAGVVLLLELGVRWSSRWKSEALQQSGVYAYRARVEPPITEGAA